MGTQTCFSKTLTVDEPSPLGSFPSQKNLDGCPPLSPLMVESFSGSSQDSRLIIESLDVEGFIENAIDEEAAADPPLAVSPSTSDGFPLTSPQTSSFQTLALVPYNPDKPENCGNEEVEEEKEEKEEEEENPWRCPFSNNDSPYMASNQFYGRRGNEFKPHGSGYCSRWAPWSSRPFSPPKEAARTEIEPTGVGAGLENLGNTCFINAVLQCFTHTVPFVLGLRSLNHQKPCARNAESFCLLCALHDHIELSLNSSGGVLSPNTIFDNLNHISSCFQRYYQEDAHEFLQCLLDRLESCCADPKLKNDSLDDCLVKKVFGGRLVSRLCCCNCGHISSTYEPLNDLSLEIEDADSLQSALESFTKVEKIEDQEAKFKCENCKEEVSIEKQYMLDEAPSVATFHLKRFKTDGAFVEKIDNHVVFPLELDLQPYTIAKPGSNAEKLRYQLYAVVKHSGFRPTYGHYLCYIRSSPDTWHRLNDSRVTRVEEADVLSQEAYILLYARQDIPWFSAAIEVQKPCANPYPSETSPKSVLDNMEMAGPSNILVKSNADCAANESKDVADRTSTQFSYKTQCEVEVEPCVAAELISRSPANESGFHESKYIYLRDDSPVIDASMPPGSSNCCNEFDKNRSSVSPRGKNNCNQGVEDANCSSSPLSSSRSQCPDRYQRNSSECIPRANWKDEKRGGNISQRAVNRPGMDQGRIEAMRYAKRMPTSRGAKFMALLTPTGKIKKRTGSSPCKRVSPRRRHNHSLIHPVSVSR